MSQFEYTDINKFLLSIGLFLIGFTFLLPWLIFREDFNLLITNDELNKYTEVARRVLLQRQRNVPLFQTISLIVSGLTLIVGIFLIRKGILGWIKSERLKREANQISNKLATPPLGEGPIGAVAENEGNGIEGEAIPIKVPINYLWDLNHWGSDVAKIKNEKIIFSGTKTRLDTDGCNISLKDILEVGKSYKISCFTKSEAGTTGAFQLWCHDNIGIEPHGSQKAMAYLTPSVEGERCSLKFDATFNRNIRIHLQYKPGLGTIEVNDVTITPL